MTLVSKLIGEIRRGRAIKRWVYLGPQGWLEEVYQNRVMSSLWKNYFQVSKETFDYVCELVAPDLQIKNSRFRSAVSLTKHIAMLRYGG